MVSSCGTFVLSFIYGGGGGFISLRLVSRRVHLEREGGGGWRNGAVGVLLSVGGTVLALTLVVDVKTARMSLTSSTPGRHCRPAARRISGRTSPTSRTVTTCSSAATASASSCTSMSSGSGHTCRSGCDLNGCSSPFSFVNSMFNNKTLSIVVVFYVVFNLLFIFTPLVVIFLIVECLVHHRGSQVGLTRVTVRGNVGIPRDSHPVSGRDSRCLIGQKLEGTFLKTNLYTVFT